MSTLTKKKFEVIKEYLDLDPELLIMHSWIADTSSIYEYHEIYFKGCEHILWFKVNNLFISDILYDHYNTMTFLSHSYKIPKGLLPLFCGDSSDRAVALEIFNLKKEII